MPRTRRRARVWTLQVAVAIVAVALAGIVGVERTMTRRADRLARALWHAQVGANEANFAAFHTQKARLLAPLGGAGARILPVESSTDAMAESLRISRRHALKARYHLDLERAYRTSADHPWAAPPVELPEPP